MTGRTRGPDLWELVEDVGNCIEYTGYIAPSGHGRYRGYFWAHRVAFERYYGYAPKLPMCVMHMCHNPRCVNPLHLEEGLRGTNTRDAAAEGAHLKKLEHPDVVAILRDGRPQSAIAKAFGVHPSLISRIKSGTRHTELQRRMAS